MNTNSQYISRNLHELGISVLYHTVTGDNPIRLRAAFEEAAGRSDIVIATGGLGPTQDDLTKETAAELMGVEMEVNEEWMARLRMMFGENMPKNNIKQAYIPKDSIILKNENGTAPGVIIENEDKSKAIILLPGPPFEMVPMFDQDVLPYLMKKTGKSFFSRYYKVFGYGESGLEEILIDLIESTNPTLATYAKETAVLLRLTANADTEVEADKILDPVEKLIYERVGDGIYATEDITLSEAVADLLKEKKLTVATAESCTGGLVAALLTEIPGASAYFYGSIVTYANDAKKRFVGVKEETLELFGAVSEETAREMVEGLIAATGVDAGIAVTGIAGPEGGSDDKPVGTAYVAVHYDGETSVQHVLYPARRRRFVQIRVANYALNMLRRLILDNQ